jgi:hypothetical protein
LKSTTVSPFLNEVFRIASGVGAIACSEVVAEPFVIAVVLINDVSAVPAPISGSHYPAPAFLNESPDGAQPRQSGLH